MTTKEALSSEIEAALIESTRILINSGVSQLTTLSSEEHLEYLLGKINDNPDDHYARELERKESIELTNPVHTYTISEWNQDKHDHEVQKVFIPSIRSIECWHAAELMLVVLNEPNFSDPEDVIEIAKINPDGSVFPYWLPYEAWANDLTFEENPTVAAHPVLVDTLEGLSNAELLKQALKESHKLIAEMNWQPRFDNPYL